MDYGEDYFERGEETGLSLYSNYRWLPEQTIPLAHELVVQLGIKKIDDILDFGCSKGYLVRALRLLHHQAYGYDVSEYAVSCAPEDVKKYVTTSKSMFPRARSSWAAYDWVIAKDVLEHVSYADLPRVVRDLRSVAKNLFAVVPLGDGEKYHYPEYEKDVTHVVRQDLSWWTDVFTAAGFEVLVASTNMLRIKDRCPDPLANGFFVLR